MQFSFFPLPPVFKLLGNHGYYRNKPNKHFRLVPLTKEVINQEYNLLNACCAAGTTGRLEGVRRNWVSPLMAMVGPNSKENLPVPL